MGKKSEETMNEIEETRDALGEKVDELVDRVREGANTAGRNSLKVAGIALGAVVGILMLKKLRNRRR